MEVVKCLRGGCRKNNPIDLLDEKLILFACIFIYTWMSDELITYTISFLYMPSILDENKKIYLGWHA